MLDQLKVLDLRTKLISIDSNIYRNTYTRLNAVCKVFEGKTLIEIKEETDLSIASVLRWRDWYLNNESIEIFLAINNRPLIYSSWDSSNDEMLAKNLRNELKSLDKNRYPNTFVRLNAICEVLGGIEIQEVVKAWEITYQSSITKWRDWYLEDGNIENIKALETKEINKWDATNDQLYANSLRKELLEFNKEQSPNTYKRLCATYKILNGSTFKEIAKELNVKSHSNIIKWRDWYVENLSIDKIKNRENYKINQSKRDTTFDHICVDIIEFEFLSLDENEYPKTTKRLKAVCEVFKGASIKSVAQMFELQTPKSISKWMSLFLEDLSIEKIKKMENIKITFNKYDKLILKEKAGILREEIEKLDKSKYHIAIKKLNAVLDVLDGSTLETAAKKWELDPNIVFRTRNLFLDNDGFIEGIKSLINKKAKKRDTSNYSSYGIQLQKELNDLDKKRFPKTAIRASALLLVFIEKKTNEYAGKTVGKSASVIRGWIKKYIEGGDIEALKKMEKQPLSRARDSSEKKKLIPVLEKELKKIDQQKNPLGFIKARTILQFLREDIDKDKAAEANNCGVKTIEGWVRDCFKYGVVEYLLRVEKSVKNKKMAKQNAKSKQEEEVNLDPIDKSTELLHRLAVVPKRTEKRSTNERSTVNNQNQPKSKKQKTQNNIYAV